MAKRFRAEFVTQRGWKESTVDDYRRRLNVFQKDFGSKLAGQLTRKDLADFLDPFAPRTQIAHKNILDKFCRFCMSAGVMDENLVEHYLTKPYSVQRKRLTLEAYKSIRDRALNTKGYEWFGRTMDVALHSLQREEDIALMKFESVRDGKLPVIQTKTGAAVMITIGAPLAKAIAACRDDILSPYIAHRNPQKRIRAKWRTHYTQVSGDTLSRAFAHVRELTALYTDWDAAQRPSFHEIRALGAKLLEEKSINPQALLGHKDPETTKIYLDRHKVEWIEAEGGIPGID
jgi:integrase